MRASAKITGIDELFKGLSEFMTDANKGIKKAVDRTAFAIESDAKKKLRNDGHVITARLMSSIHAELHPGESFSYNDNKGQSWDGALHEMFDKLEAAAGTNVYYGPFIEFGTKYISADSFLGWAAIKQEPLLKQRVTDELNKLIKKL